MKHSSLILVAWFFLTILSFQVYSQCPSNEADLADGGTFSGNCTVNVGGSITVTGNIIWTSGRLTINDTGGGGDGDLFINSGGSITVQNGAVLDMDDGDITVNSGASLTINSGGSVEILDVDRELYIDGGTVNVDGTLGITVDLEISNGGTLNANSGSNVTVGDDLLLSGSSAINISGGTVDVADMVEADNSSIDVSGGTFDTGGGTADWIWVYNGGSLTQSGGTISTAGDMYVEDATLSMTGGSYTGDDYYVYGTSTVDLDGGTVNTDNLYSYGDATLTVDGADLNAGILSAQGNGTLNLTSGTITSNDYMYAEDNAVININTTVTNTAGATDQSIDIYIYSSSTINIGAGADVSGYNDITFEGGDNGTATLNVTGGSLSVEDDLNLDNTSNDQVNISGGTVTIPNDIDILDTNATITVTGGSLNAGVIDDTSNGGSTVSDNITVTGGGTVSEGGVVVLPVELISFSGSLQNGQILLIWKTAAELNNERFDIQKSIDGVTFLTIGTVKGNGTTSEQNHYQFADKSLSEGTFFYRLIQYDFDGESETLPTISIVNELISTSSSISIYPNPVINEKITIQLSGKIILNDWEVNIFNMKGQLMLSQKGSAGSPEMTLDQIKNKLGEGYYLLQVQGKEAGFSKKILIR